MEGTSRLGLQLTGMTLADGTQANVQSSLVNRNGQTSVGNDVAAVGTTTAVGAAIGAADRGRLGAHGGQMAAGFGHELLGFGDGSLGVLGVGFQALGSRWGGLDLGAADQAQSGQGSKSTGRRRVRFSSAPRTLSASAGVTSPDP